MSSRVYPVKCLKVLISAAFIFLSLPPIPMSHYHILPLVWVIYCIISCTYISGRYFTEVSVNYSTFTCECSPLSLLTSGLIKFAKYLNSRTFSVVLLHIVFLHLTNSFSSKGYCFHFIRINFNLNCYDVGLAHSPLQWSANKWYEML
jgi:hypothetical protein